MPKIVCISDTHTYENFEVPEGDILIHSGDISSRGSFAEMNRAMIWLGKFPHKFKIFVCGNHDFLGEQDPSLMKALAEENGVIYLDEGSVDVFGLKVFGSPWTPWFHSWAFNAQRGEEIARHWAKIPENTNVLITHGPPFGILDVNTEEPYHKHLGPEHLGCEELRKRVDQLKDLKLHVFGHIHSSNSFEEINGVKFINAAICNESYEPIQPARIVEL